MVKAFAAVGLDWRSHVKIDRSLFRMTGLARGLGDLSKAKISLDGKHFIKYYMW